MNKTDIRHDWTVDEVLGLLSAPWEELKTRAERVHQRYGDRDVQKCVLLSVKTGACPEDCSYCSQSAHYETDLATESLLSVDKVLLAAKVAKQSGATRFCMGAAWRDVPKDQRFEDLKEMVRGVARTGMEVCCTLGMATEEQLVELKEAGLTAYNHNLDTGRNHYSKVVSTRTYDERLKTLKAVRNSGVQICSGGILGLGESLKDRAEMLVDLAQMNPHPESVPINLLVPIKGTPFEKNDSVSFEEFIRMIAVTRILMPKSRVRLSAGRNSLTNEQQLECFKVGANSIFAGEKLLTTPNVSEQQDQALYDEVSNSI